MLIYGGKKEKKTSYKVKTDKDEKKKSYKVKSDKEEKKDRATTPKKFKVKKVDPNDLPPAFRNMM